MVPFADLLIVVFIIIVKKKNGTGLEQYCADLIHFNSHYDHVCYTHCSKMITNKKNRNLLPKTKDYRTV